MWKKSPPLVSLQKNSRGHTRADRAQQFTPTAVSYLLSLHKSSSRSPVCNLVKHANTNTGPASRTQARTDPCRRRPPSLSLTSGALRPLSLQHLISPLNLRLTRSFCSKGLPLCLQPSSTNGAWRGIEGRWRVAAVSAVVSWKNQPRGEKESRVRSIGLPEACVTEGHPERMCVYGDGSLYSLLVEAVDTVMCH